MGSNEGFPFRLPAFHGSAPGAKPCAIDRGFGVIQTLQKLAHEGLSVRNDAQGGGIVSPQFLRINIDVNQTRTREIPRVTRLPARCRTIIKARADGEYEVREPARLISRVGPVAANETQR